MYLVVKNFIDTVFYEESYFFLSLTICVVLHTVFVIQLKFSSVMVVLYVT